MTAQERDALLCVLTNPIGDGALFAVTTERVLIRRLFFDLIGQRMGEDLLLFLAYRGSRPVAALIIVSARVT